MICPAPSPNSERRPGRWRPAAPRARAGSSARFRSVDHGPSPTSHQHLPSRSALQADCLQADGSLLFEGAQVWTKGNLEELERVFIKSPDTSKRTFLEKFRDQLNGASKGAIRLAAEVILLHFLFPTSVTGATKRGLVRTVLKWADEAVDDAHPAMAALGGGIGSGGQGFNTRRPLEIAFVINLGLALKRDYPNSQHTSMFKTAWAFRDVVDEVVEADSRQMRHMLLHLLFPDEFERIASANHKRRIDRTFRSLVAGDVEDLDERILAIRNELKNLLGTTALDFYRPPLVNAWYSSDEDNDEDVIPRDAILHKKQLVFYGPPGTGKTHQAKALAADLIRSAALEKLGAPWYFQNLALVEQATKDHTRRLQLHPAYSYEDFIRGLHVGDGGKTEYRRGYLPVLLDSIARERAEGSPTAALPYVLILDEMNRTDLSRLLGECFSLLEDRGSTVDLPGLDADHKPLTIALPEDLYVIGTMNLIDQSIEQIDFALRRRFLWQPSRFDHRALVQVCEQRWRAVPIGPHNWEAVRADFQRLAAAATALNETIHKSPLLGEQYEIGHTYFFDAVPFLRQEIAARWKKKRDSYLWIKCKPEGTLRSLWRLSLEPLLREYLRGLDEQARRKEVDRLEKAFFTYPPLDDE